MNGFLDRGILSGKTSKIASALAGIYNWIATAAG